MLVEPALPPGMRRLAAGRGIVAKPPRGQVSEVDGSFERDILRRLEEAGIDYFVTGSVALGAWATFRQTNDVDLVVRLTLSEVGGCNGEPRPEHALVSRIGLSSVTFGE
jgi:hypothetical protein